jgi:predicted nucleic acid-binding protein
VSSVRSRGPIVIDTDVFSYLVRDLPRACAAHYRSTGIHLFQTAAELRYGAVRRGWGQPRMLRLDAKIQRIEVVHSGRELVAI